MGSRLPVLLVVFVLAFALSVTVAGQEPEKAVAEELKRLDGEWQIVAAEAEGAAMEHNSDRVVFSGGKCTVTVPGAKVVLENTISIDPSKSPKRIELTNTKTKEVWSGIYEIKGETLRCLWVGKDAKLLTEFKTRAGQPGVLFTYKRAKGE